MTLDTVAVLSRTKPSTELIFIQVYWIYVNLHYVLNITKMATAFPISFKANPTLAPTHRLSLYVCQKKGTGNTAMAAVIEGDYKLVVLEVEKQVSLYKLDTDPGEKTDLSQSHPEITERLLKYIKITSKNFRLHL